MRALPLAVSRECATATRYLPDTVIAELHVRIFIFVAIALFAFAPWSANALGLGSVVGEPVLLQPLKVEIPLLLATDEPIPKLDCIKIVAPPDGQDQQFFPKYTKLALDLSAQPRILITSGQTVRDPLIEFRIVLGCSGEITRDYLLLTRQAETKDGGSNEISGTAVTVASNHNANAPSRSPSVEPLSIPAAQAGISLRPTTTDSVHSTVPGSPTARLTMKLQRDTTLNQLARVRYPSNQATRDEYRRLMALANPELFANAAQVGSIPLSAGTVLVIPDNLPTPEQVVAANKNNNVEPPPVTTNKPLKQPLRSSPDSDVGRSASRDRLVIGGNPSNGSGRALSSKEAQATIERLEQILLAQAVSDQEMHEKLKTLENLFASNKSQLQFLEAKSKQQEAEQRQLQAKLDAKPEPKSFGVLELLGLIFTFGAVGAGLLTLSHRQQMQRIESTSTNRSLAEIQPHPIFTASTSPELYESDGGINPFAQRATSDSTGHVAESSPINAGTIIPSSPKSPRGDSGTAAEQTLSGEPLSRLNSGEVDFRQKVERSVAQQNSQTDSQDSIAAPETPTAPSVSAPPDEPLHRPTDHIIEFTLSEPNKPASVTVDKTVDSLELPQINFALDLDQLPPARQQNEVPMSLGQLSTEIGAKDLPDETANPASAEPVEFDLTPRTNAEIEAAMAIENELAAKPQASIAEPKISESAEDPAVELANIMISMGMRKDAERTLIDYILDDPKRDLGPWLKALEIYRKSGRREEFEKLAISLRKNLNVAPDEWDIVPSATKPTLEAFPRVNETIQRLWPTAEVEKYLASLLGDNRDGSRAGFPQAVAEDILWLMRILRVRKELT
ncbi:MAG: hypothetical protein IPO13_04840 [Rhodocyclaceae bacterium]|nr:hypothetical protein [Rhodocyclaceae bacterium]